jgi:hypothetical protein
VDTNPDLESAYEVFIEKKIEGIRVDEGFVANMTKKNYNLYFVNSEDSQVLQTYNLDFTGKFYKNPNFLVLLLDNQFSF